ncbi:MAG: alpha/beta hydrolase [Candidatus Jordarchaeaceae archaeon]
MNEELKKAGIEEKYFDTGEVKLNYVAGPPNGTPMVFIPGQTMTWEEYYLLLPKLAHRFQVFAVTLRGHGNSSKTPGQYTFNILGKDMTAFLREVVGKAAIVGGNSSGGVLAVWLAANSPEWVKGVICEDPPLFTCEWPLIKKTWVYDVFKMAARTMDSPGGSPKFLQESVAMYPDEVKRNLEQIMGKALPVMFKAVSQFDATFSKAFADGTMGEGFDHATALAKVTQPMLFLHAKWFMIEGRLLGSISDKEVARVKSLVKGSWKYVNMNCGHAIPLEKPDEESKEIMDWVDEYLTD